MYSVIPDLKGGKEIVVTPHPVPQPQPQSLYLLNGNTSNSELSRGWKIVQGLSGGLVIFYNKTKGLLEVYRTQPDGRLGERLQSHTQFGAGWDIIVEMQPGRLLCYDKQNNRAAAYEFNADGTRGRKVRGVVPRSVE
jgi:hypothetical protein